jgi:predicted RNA binding protein YcfA (HicA-like mRNA interferase family)
MKPAELERIIKADGWYLLRQKGSHRVYAHPTKPGRVVIPWHGKDLPAGTVHNILRVAQIQ